MTARRHLVLHLGAMSLTSRSKRTTWGSTARSAQGPRGEQRDPRYRRVRAEDLGGIATLLPTFRHPHWTALFDSPGPATIQRLLDALGPVLDNPEYRHRARARPSPCCRHSTLPAHQVRGACPRQPVPATR